MLYRFHDYNHDSMPVALYSRFPIGLLCKAEAAVCMNSNIHSANLDPVAIAAVQDFTGVSPLDLKLFVQISDAVWSKPLRS